MVTHKIKTVFASNGDQIIDFFSSHLISKTIFPMQAIEILYRYSIHGACPIRWLI